MDLGSGVPLQKKVTSNSKIPADDEVVGLDAYKVAVLVSISLAILSLWF